MNPDKIRQLQIEPEAKRRSQSSIGWIFLVVALATATVLYFAWPREGDDRRIIGRASDKGATSSSKSSTSAKSPSKAHETQLASNSAVATSQTNGSILTVSGYIVNRERIEISPRFLGQVKWIGVRKGDTVTNGQVLVRLEDSEQRARVKETEGRLATTRANLRKAELDFDRVSKLIADRIETEQAKDDAGVRLDAARAAFQEAEASLDIARTYLDWTVIRSPINGVVLEKLVDAAELVTPQSFGGTRGPSTALLAVADPKDLQVEIDLNESDLAKVSLKQRCKVSPEAYPDKVYEGYVAEIAPEADRQKGTLEVKVQIVDPDRFLTPELSAKVDFLGRQ